MRKILKENKGFSLVELLVAILIMAVIAATAIALFGGVLDSSRKSADEETAESIKRAILTYMNMSNDVDLNAIDVAHNSDSIDLIKKLCCTITIKDSASGNTKDATFKASTLVTVTPPTDVTGKGDASDLSGDYGPFLDPTKDLTTKTPGTNGWAIDIDTKAQVITVKTVEDAKDAIVKFHPAPTGTPGGSATP